VYESKNGKKPSFKEICEALEVNNVRGKMIQELFEMKYMSSLDYSFGEEGEQDLYDVIASPKEYEPFELFHKKSISNKIQAILENNSDINIPSLTQKEKKVISMRY
jgi:DNA-directed RNA polymerase sigma subunit (sigma70/sigma32)